MYHTGDLHQRSEKKESISLAQQYNDETRNDGWAPVVSCGPSISHNNGVGGIVCNAVAPSNYFRLEFPIAPMGVFGSSSPSSWWDIKCQLCSACVSEVAAAIGDHCSQPGKPRQVKVRHR